MSKSKRLIQKHILRPLENEGVSEIIGTMLLLLIAIALFSVLYYGVYSFQPEGRATDAEVIFRVEGNNITLFHLRGESIHPDSIISITINDSKDSKKISEFSNWDSNGDSRFNVGESIFYSPSTKGDIQTEEIVVQLIDSQSDKLLVGAINKEEEKVFSEIPVISSPYPANGSVDVQLNESLGITVYDLNEELLKISWFVKNGSSWDLLGSSVEWNGRYYLSSSNFSSYETMYYWKVIVSDDEHSIESSVYQFTTVSEDGNSAPSLHYLSPSDNAVDIPLETNISWSATDVDNDNITFDVYFGNSSPPTLVSQNQTDSFYEPSKLDDNTTYYWSIIAWDEHNASDIGSIWQFTSVDTTPIETIEFSDSFENGQWDGKWVEDSQNDWMTDDQRSSNGGDSAEVDGYTNQATLTLQNAIDLSGKSSANVTFDWYVEYRLDTGEYISFEVYDGSWHELARLPGVDGYGIQEEKWISMNIDLSSYLVSNFKIRFVAKIGSSNEDANVDNVRIVSYS